MVSDIFRHLGIPVYDADSEARILTETDEEIKSEIKKYFDNEVFLSDGSLDRAKLASLVFSDRKKLTQLNSIIHPFVKKHFEGWLQRHNKSKYIIKEAAILFESESDKGLDKIICVTAPEKIRIQRVMARDNTDEKKVRSIMGNQMSEEERIKRSDFIITNDDRTLVIPQVLELHSLLSNEAAHPT